MLFDASTPLYAVDSQVNVGLLAYLQALDLWGRTSTIMVELPYSWGSTKGIFVDRPASTDFSGLAELGYRFYDQYTELKTIWVDLTDSATEDKVQ